MFFILHKLLFILFMFSFSSYGNDKNKCPENFSKNTISESTAINPKQTPRIGKNLNKIFPTMDYFVHGMISLLRILETLDSTIQEYYTFNPEIQTIFSKIKKLTYVGDLIQITKKNLMDLTGITKESADLVEQEIASKNNNFSLGMQLEGAWNRPNPFSQEQAIKENKKIDPETQIEITTEEMMVLGRAFGVINTTALQQDFLNVLNHSGIYTYRNLIDKREKDLQQSMGGMPLDDFDRVINGEKMELVSLAVIYALYKQSLRQSSPSAENFEKTGL